MTTPIRIGEVNTYSPSALTPFMTTYRYGIEMCVAEVNAAGGVLGRPLEVVYADDGLDKAQAQRVTAALIEDDKVDLVAGTFTSDIGLAVAEVADRLKRVFVATEPRTDAMTREEGSRYVFRIRTSQAMMIAMLASRAARLPHKRWTVIAPSYAGGKRIGRMAREAFAKLRPDVVFAPDVHFDLGSLDAATVDALVATEPEVIFSIVYGSDLLPFVRLGRERGLFERTTLISPLGDPEYLTTTGAETPEGWLVLGYPGEQDARPSHLQFMRDFRRRFAAEPDAAALIGYMGFQAIAAGLARAGTTDTEALVAAFRGLEYDSPIGRIRIRRGDHQATVGNWIGTTAIRNGQAVVADPVFLDGADYLPPEEEVALLRPPQARA